MDAGTSTLNPPFVPGQSAGPGPAQSHGPGAAPVSEEQTHHKPFFYVQPSHPFLPVQSVQWPLPVAMPFNYNPYYGGFPGFGYGLPLLPHFQPAPYMDSPGFILPHTHHHLMDYRRMLNPQYYQSMAYHARRLHYQQNVPTRDVTSCEVQTEPLPVSQHTSTPSLNQTETQNESSNLSTALSVQKDDHTLAINDLAPITANATPPKGSFVIETEEVRIECCTSPAGLQVLHSHETSEMSKRFAQDVVHCSSVMQNSMLPDDNVQIVNTESKNVHSLQPCPDILLVASPNANDKSVELETTVASNSKIKMSADVEAIRNEKNLKVVRLPFNAKYLAELRKIESSVWSTEETLIPSSEFIMDSCNETFLGEVPSAEILTARDKTGQDDVVPIVHLPTTMNEELEDGVPTFENPVVDLPHKEIQKQAGIYGKMDLKCSQNLLSDDLPLDGNLQEQPDTSFESLPAYLPSTSWLADFENASYTKMPPTPQKLNKQIGSRGLIVPGRRRKLDAEFKDVTAIPKPKEGYKPKGKADRRSLSDHECCVSRSYNENAFVSYETKGQRLCTGCMTKQKIYKTSASPAQVSKRKMTPFQPWNDGVLTCEACKGHTNKQFTRKCSNPEIRVDRDGEISQNGCKWRLDEMRKETKRPLALKPQNVEKCYSKMRERGCAYGEPQQSQWRRVYHCCHGNAIREADENRAMATGPEQVYVAHRWQTEKPWISAPVHNTESLKNDFIRAQHLNLHKKSLPLPQVKGSLPLPLPQGTHRKDTWC